MTISNSANINTQSEAGKEVEKKEAPKKTYENQGFISASGVLFFYTNEPGSYEKAVKEAREYSLD